jgi:hypothetical protein
MANPTTPAPVPPQQPAPSKTPAQTPAQNPPPAQNPNPAQATPNPVNPVTGQEDVLANQQPDRPDDFKPVAAPEHDPVTGNPFPVKKFERGDEGEIKPVETSEEVPHVTPPKPNKYPLSSAPVDPEAPPPAKTTQSIQ